MRAYRRTLVCVLLIGCCCPGNVPALGSARGTPPLLVAARKSFQPRAMPGFPIEFRAVWQLARARDNVCTARDWEEHGNDGLIRVGSNSVQEWESACDLLSTGKFNRTAEPEGMAIETELHLKCGGEGMTWRTTEVWQTQVIEGHAMLIRVSQKAWDFYDDNGKKMPDEPGGTRISIYMKCN